MTTRSCSNRALFSRDAPAERGLPRSAGASRLNKKALELLVFALVAAGCGRSPPYAGRSVAQLERMLADPNPTTQAQGALGLSLHGAAAQPATAALIRALASPDALVRQQAGLALGKIGPGAEEAVPALVAAMDDPEWAVRRQAVVALGQIGPPLSGVETPLRQCERDANTLVRKAAREALATLHQTKGR